MGRQRQEQQGIFTAPMDHSYRANMGMNNGNGNGNGKVGLGFPQPAVPVSASLAQPAGSPLTASP